MQAEVKIGFYLVLQPISSPTSPSNFTLVLDRSTPSILSLANSFKTNPPLPAPQNWKIGRMETLSVRHEDGWHRGVAVKKIGAEYEIFLLDRGIYVVAGREGLRSLPEQMAKIPAIALQVTFLILFALLFFSGLYFWFGPCCWRGMEWPGLCKVCFPLRLCFRGGGDRQGRRW